MNYILLLWNYGKESMKMTVDQMTEPCNLILKKKSGEWVVYSPDTEEMESESQFAQLPSVMKILKENDIINWGNYIFSNDEYFRINKPSAIILASDKRRSRRYLQDSGIAVPFSQFYGEWLKFPCIARPPQHHGGQHFYVLNSEEDLQNLQKKEYLGDWYFSEIFEKTTEFRVHCAHGRVLMVQEKPLVEGEIRANQAVNHEQWRVLKWGEIHNGIALESLKAIEILGLDYGAVDIMYNAQNDSWAVCEVNTSPSINTEYSAGKYAKYFSWLIRNNFPSHFSLAGGFGKNKYIFDNEMLGEIL